MRWAADNPERYNELVRQGIIRYLDTILSNAGFDAPGKWSEGYAALLEVLQAEPSAHHVYDALLVLASRHILEEEADYHGGFIDQAKERFDV